MIVISTRKLQQLLNEYLGGSKTETLMSELIVTACFFQGKFDSLLLVPLEKASALRFENVQHAQLLGDDQDIPAGIPSIRFT